MKPANDTFMQVGKNMGRAVPFLLASIGLTAIFSLFLLDSPNPSKFVPIHDGPDQKIIMINQQKEEGNCDLFKGHWIPEINKEHQYTNSSCATIPDSKNCFRHGRGDRDFLNWRWKPDRCDLPRFDPKAFLEILRGKTLAFIGDSVARNHMESLVCLLSKVSAVPFFLDQNETHALAEFTFLTLILSVYQGVIPVLEWVAK
uniref:Trichome birefringence-like N-terminal domain-containing protein n=1 Tax=Rhizophora mucronata TaxID=61149 RepID=A0A2P2J2Y2_RHIMU